MKSFILLIAGLSILSATAGCFPDFDLQWPSVVTLANLPQPQLADFSTFEYTQTGECPQKGLHRAAITRVEDGTYLLEMAAIETVTPDSPDCVPGALLYDGDTCIISRELPDRILDENERQRVLEVFGDTQYAAFLIWKDSCSAIEPLCRVDEFVWDGERAPNGIACTVGLHTRISTGQAILDLLESLRSEGD